MNFGYLYLMLIIAFTATRALTALNGSLILLIIFFNLILILKKNKIEKFNQNKLSLLYTILLVSVVLGLIFRVSLHQTSSLFRVVNTFLQFSAISLIVSFSLFDNKRKYFLKYIFYLLIFIAFLQRIFLFFTSFNPSIDVYVQLKEAPLKLFIQGQNPYQAIFSQTYPNKKADYFNYLPGVIYLFAPFSLVFKEPRLLLFLAEGLAGLILYYLSGKKFKQKTFILILIYYFNPVSLFVLESAWLEPLIFFSLIVYLFLLKKQQAYWASLILGLLISLKQTLFTLPIFILRISLKYFKSLILTFVIFIFLTLPFIIWSPKDFFNDTVFYFSSNPSLLPTGLTLGRLVKESLHLSLPLFIFYLIPLVFSLLSLIWEKKQAKSFVLSFLISQFALYLFGIQAMINLLLFFKLPFTISYGY